MTRATKEVGETLLLPVCVAYACTAYACTAYVRDVLRRPSGTSEGQLIFRFISQKGENLPYRSATNTAEIDFSLCTLIQKEGA